PVRGGRAGRRRAQDGRAAADRPAGAVAGADGRAGGAKGPGPRLPSRPLRPAPGDRGPPLSGETTKDTKSTKRKTASRAGIESESRPRRAPLPFSWFSCLSWFPPSARLNGLNNKDFR